MRVLRRFFVVALSGAPRITAAAALRVVMLSIVSLFERGALEAQELGWSASVDASANIIFGAARGRLGSFAAAASRADSLLELQADALVAYADARTDDDRRRVTARTSRLSLGTDYRPFARVSAFWLGSVESNYQQRIAHRYSAGAGAKLTLYRRDDDDVSMSLAALWERTTVLRAAPLTRPHLTRARWSLRARVRRDLAPGIRLTHVTFYQPAVDRPARFFVDTDTSLAISVTRALALTATLRGRFDSEAHQRGARSNHDGQVLFGMRASF
jgi:hypothetical protein